MIKKREKKFCALKFVRKSNKIISVVPNQSGTSMIWQKKERKEKKKKIPKCLIYKKESQ